MAQFQLIFPKRLFLIAMVKRPYFNESIHKYHVANDKLPRLHEDIANRLVCHDMGSISNEVNGGGDSDNEYPLEDSYDDVWRTLFFVIKAKKN